MQVPQGAIICYRVRGSLYVDEFCICFRKKSLIAFKRQIQRCINSIQKWADEK